MACLTLFFKATALLFYLFSGLLTNFVFTFVITTLLNTIDFWIVKNISGRMLVGLRWWRRKDRSQGTSSVFQDTVSSYESYRFESYLHSSQCSRSDKTVFWSSQIVGSALWSLLFLSNAISLNGLYALLTAVQSTLLLVNLYHYYLCRAGIPILYNQSSTSRCMSTTSATSNRPSPARECMVFAR